MFTSYKSPTVVQNISCGFQWMWQVPQCTGMCKNAFCDVLPADVLPPTSALAMRF